MKTLSLTGVIVLCAVAITQSASASTAAQLASQLNIYADTYSPKVSRSITVTAQFADANGLPVNDNAFSGFTAITVNWSVSNGAYSITSSSTTNALGYATATLTVPASANQSCTVTATSAGGFSATSDTITSVASVGSATKYIVTLSDYNPVISTSTTTVTAQLVDVNNNPVSSSGRTVTWGGAGGGSFGSATSTTNGSGTATVTFTTAASMATYVITANDGTFSGTALPASSAAVTPVDTLTTPVPYFLDYNRIQGIFSNKCTGCHTTGVQTPYYNPGVSYGNTVNVVGASAGLKYFNPSDAATSYIFRKVHETSPPGGGVRMPQGGPYINAADQQIFRDWINQGCLNRTVSTSLLMSPSTTSPAAGGTVTITAQLRDSTNAAIKIPGMLVTWTKSGTNGSFGGSATGTSHTDANGLATIVFTADTVSNQSCTITATSGSITGTTATITTTFGAATHYIMNPSTTSPLAGSTVTITAQLADQYGNSVSAVRSVTWSHSSAGSGASFSSNPTNTNGSGLATVTFTASTTAGTAETVTANDGSVSGTTATITTQSASYVVTITQSSPYTVNQTLNITAQLFNGSNVLQAGHVVTFTASGPGGTFTPSTPVTTNASGQALVQFTTSTTAGAITITATEGSSTGNKMITTNPAAPNGYMVSVTNTTPTVNTSITATAQLVDQYNNAISTPGLSVTWSATGQGGTFGPNPTTTDTSGQTSISFTCATTAGATTITATDTNSKTGSKGITAQAGAANKYVIATTSPVTVNTTHAVTAQLSDVFGNPVSGLKTVTWSATSVGGNFSSPTSATNASGLATVNFTASTTAGSTVINGSDGTFQGNSSTVTINPGPANKYIVTSSTSSPQAGSGVTINAQLTDSFGNALSTSGLVVNWSLTAGTGGNFSNPTSNTNSSGLATITFTTSNTAGTSYTVQALESTHSGTVSFTSVAGTPVACPLLVAPTNPVAGTSVTVTGQLKDSNGNNVSRSGIVIIWSSDASGAFATGTSTSNSSGQVSVNFTTGPKANVTFNLTATDGALITGSAAPFTTTTGAAAAYKVSVSNTAPVAGTPVTVSAQLIDANGNAVSTAGQTVTWSQTGTGGSFATATSLTNASGVATVSFTMATTSGTTTSFAATTGGFTGSSPSVTTINGPAVKYVVSASSTAVSAGTAVRIGAQLVDANGNLVQTANKTVTWALSGDNGFLSVPSSTTDTSGSAAVVLSTSPTGGVTYVVTGTDSDGLTGASPSIVVAIGSPATGNSPLITSALTVNTAAGANFSYPITVTGDQPITFGADNLPLGLLLSGDTITGEVAAAGTYVVHVTASNTFGTDAIDLVIVAAPTQPLSVDRAQVKLNFAAKNTDALTAQFSLTLPDGTDASNPVVSVQFGTANFNDMSALASTKSRTPRAAGSGAMATTVSIKPANKGSSLQNITVNIKNANLKDALAANGLLNGDISGTVTVPVVVNLTVDGGTFYCSGDAEMQYKARKNKSGLAKK